MVLQIASGKDHYLNRRPTICSTRNVLGVPSRRMAGSGGPAGPSLVELRPPAALLAIVVQRTYLKLRQVQRDQLLVGSVCQIGLQHHLESAGRVLEY
jgi:hypothetical protein